MFIKKPEVTVVIEIQDQDDSFYDGKETASIIKAMLKVYFLGCKRSESP
jgi:hypothetical protein